MIEKFIAGEETIRLRNADLSQQPDDNGMQLEQNIFSIDSLSLVIGPNGSGKTRLLDAIWDTMDSESDEAWQHPWQPIFHKNSTVNTNNVGVIFFSHAPNKVARKKSGSKRCIDASPSRSRRYLPESMLGQESILKQVIKRDSRFVAEFRAELHVILARAVQLMLEEKLDPPAEWEDFDQVLIDLVPLYRSVVATASQRATFSQVAPVRNVVGINAEFDHEFNNACRILFEALMANFDRTAVLTNLMVLYFYVKSYKASDGLLIWVFCSNFGFLTGTHDVQIDDSFSDLFATRRDEVAELLDRASQTGNVSQSSRVLKFTLELDGTRDLKRYRQSFLEKLMTVGWSNVSSGQWALVTQFMEIETAFTRLVRKKGIRSVLVLIDEGDAFLHLEWQREYISTLNHMLSEMKRQSEGKIEYVQALVATHSPLLASDVPSNYVNRLSDGRVVGDAAAFAAPYQSLLNGSFGAKSIGAHATHVIRETVENVRLNQVTSHDHYVARIVDDPIIRRELGELLDIQEQGQR